VICDPREEEQAGVAFALRGGDIDRGDKQAVKLHLGQKYKLENVNLETLMRFSAIIEKRPD
jgi:hypothetical protein